MASATRRRGVLTDPAAVAEWFLNERGITAETLQRFGVGVRTDGAVVIPYSQGNKIRKGLPHGERAFFFEGSLTLFNEVQAATQTVILVEGETDTMRLSQELADTPNIGVVGFPGIETWRPAFAQALSSAETVYVILDNDKDYMVQGRVDNAWRQIREDLGRKAKRVRLPSDVKDTCEFFTRYDLPTLLELLENQPSLSRFTPLDLTIDPPPVQWLVEGMVALGDVSLWLGEPSIGKSWLAMSLALAVAQGQPWLGRPTIQGPVLYVDEENPIDLVYDRLIRLGFTPPDSQFLRYISNEGLLLDHKDVSDELVDEALEMEAKLIVLDSLTRIHTLDEDKAGPMSSLYNSALKPLSRKTGATVMLLHHAGKTDSNSSYRRSRGSGEIIAQIDAGYDIRHAGLNALTIANFKTRRKQMGGIVNVVIQDTPEGGVRLIGGTGATPF